MPFADYIARDDEPPSGPFSTLLSRTEGSDAPAKPKRDWGAMYDAAQRIKAREQQPEARQPNLMAAEAPNLNPTYEQVLAGTKPSFAPESPEMQQRRAKLVSSGLAADDFSRAVELNATEIGGKPVTVQDLHDNVTRPGSAWELHPLRGLMAANPGAIDIIDEMYRAGRDIADINAIASFKTTQDDLQEISEIEKWTTPLRKAVATIRETMGSIASGVSPVVRWLGAKDFAAAMDEAAQQMHEEAMYSFGDFAHPEITSEVIKKVAEREREAELRGDLLSDRHLEMLTADLESTGWRQHPVAKAFEAMGTGLGYMALMGMTGGASRIMAGPAAPIQMVTMFGLPAARQIYDQQTAKGKSEFEAVSRAFAAAAVAMFAPKWDKVPGAKQLMGKLGAGTVDRYLKAMLHSAGTMETLNLGNALAAAELSTGGLANAWEKFGAHSPASIMEGLGFAIPAMFGRGMRGAHYYHGEFAKWGKEHGIPKADVESALAKVFDYDVDAKGNVTDIRFKPGVDIAPKAFGASEGVLGVRDAISREPGIREAEAEARRAAAAKAVADAEAEEAGRFDSIISRFTTGAATPADVNDALTYLVGSESGRGYKPPEGRDVTWADVARQFDVYDQQLAIRQKAARADVEAEMAPYEGLGLTRYSLSNLRADAANKAKAKWEIASLGSDAEPASTGPSYAEALKTVPDRRKAIAEEFESTFPVIAGREPEDVKRAKEAFVARHEDSIRRAGLSTSDLSVRSVISEVSKRRAEVARKADADAAKMRGDTKSSVLKIVEEHTKERDKRLAESLGVDDPTGVLLTSERINERIEETMGLTPETNPWRTPEGDRELTSMLKRSAKEYSRLTTDLQKKRMDQRIDMLAKALDEKFSAIMAKSEPDHAELADWSARGVTESEMARKAEEVKREWESEFGTVAELLYGKDHGVSPDTIRREITRRHKDADRKRAESDRLEAGRDMVKFFTEPVAPEAVAEERFSQSVKYATGTMVEVATPRRSGEIEIKLYERMPDGLWYEKLGDEHASTPSPKRALSGGVIVRDVPGAGAPRIEAAEKRLLSEYAEATREGVPMAVGPQVVIGGKIDAEAVTLAKEMRDGRIPLNERVAYVRAELIRRLNEGEKLIESVSARNQQDADVVAKVRSAADAVRRGEAETSTVKNMLSELEKTEPPARYEAAKKAAGDTEAGSTPELRYEQFKSTLKNVGHLVNPRWLAGLFGDSGKERGDFIKAALKDGLIREVKDAEDGGQKYEAVDAKSRPLEPGDLFTIYDDSGDARLSGAPSQVLRYEGKRDGRDRVSVMSSGRVVSEGVAKIPDNYIRLSDLAILRRAEEVERGGGKSTRAELYEGSFVINTRTGASGYIRMRAGDAYAVGGDRMWPVKSVNSYDSEWVSTYRSPKSRAGENDLFLSAVESAMGSGGGRGAITLDALAEAISMGERRKSTKGAIAAARSRFMADLEKQVILSAKLAATRGGASGVDAIADSIRSERARLGLPEMEKASLDAEAQKIASWLESNKTADARYSSIISEAGTAEIAVIDRILAAAAEAYADRVAEARPSKQMRSGPNRKGESRSVAFIARRAVNAGLRPVLVHVAADLRASKSGSQPPSTRLIENALKKVASEWLRLPVDESKLSVREGREEAEAAARIEAFDAYTRKLPLADAAAFAVQNVWKAGMDRFVEENRDVLSKVSRGYAHEATGYSSTHSIERIAENIDRESLLVFEDQVREERIRLERGSPRLRETSTLEGLIDALGSGKRPPAEQPADSKAPSREEALTALDAMGNALARVRAILSREVADGVTEKTRAEIKSVLLGVAGREDRYGRSLLLRSWGRHTAMRSLPESMHPYRPLEREFENVESERPAVEKRPGEADDLRASLYADALSEIAESPAIVEPAARIPELETASPRSDGGRDARGVSHGRVGIVVRPRDPELRNAYIDLMDRYRASKVSQILGRDEMAKPSPERRILTEDEVRDVASRSQLLSDVLAFGRSAEEVGDKAVGEIPGGWAGIKNQDVLRSASAYVDDVIRHRRAHGTDRIGSSLQSAVASISPDTALADSVRIRVLDDNAPSDVRDDIVLRRGTLAESEHGRVSTIIDIAAGAARDHAEFVDLYTFLSAITGSRGLTEITAGKLTQRFNAGVVDGIRAASVAEDRAAANKVYEDAANRFALVDSKTAKSLAAGTKLTEDQFSSLKDFAENYLDTYGVEVHPRALARWIGGQREFADLSILDGMTIADIRAKRMERSLDRYAEPRDPVAEVVDAVASVSDATLAALSHRSGVESADRLRAMSPQERVLHLADAVSKSYDLRIAGDLFGYDSIDAVAKNMSRILDAAEAIRGKRSRQFLELMRVDGEAAQIAARMSARAFDFAKRAVAGDPSSGRAGTLAARAAGTARDVGNRNVGADPIVELLEPKVYSSAERAAIMLKGALIEAFAPKPGRDQSVADARVKELADKEAERLSVQFIPPGALELAASRAASQARAPIPPEYSLRGEQAGPMREKAKPAALLDGATVSWLRSQGLIYDRERTDGSSKRAETVQAVSTGELIVALLERAPEAIAKPLFERRFVEIMKAVIDSGAVTFAGLPGFNVGEAKKAKPEVWFRLLRRAVRSQSQGFPDPGTAPTLEAMRKEYGIPSERVVPKTAKQDLVRWPEADYTLPDGTVRKAYRIGSFQEDVAKPTRRRSDRELREMGLTPGTDDGESRRFASGTSGERPAYFEPDSGPAREQFMKRVNLYTDKGHGTEKYKREHPAMAPARVAAKARRATDAMRVLIDDLRRVVMDRDLSAFAEQAGQPAKIVYRISQIIDALSRNLPIPTGFPYPVMDYSAARTRHRGGAGRSFNLGGKKAYTGTSDRQEQIEAALFHALKELHVGSRAKVEGKTQTAEEREQASERWAVGKAAELHEAVTRYAALRDADLAPPKALMSRLMNDTLQTWQSSRIAKMIAEEAKGRGRSRALEVISTQPEAQRKRDGTPVQLVSVPDGVSRKTISKLAGWAVEQHVKKARKSMDDISMPFATPSGVDAQVRALARSQRGSTLSGSMSDPEGMTWRLRDGTEVAFEFGRLNRDGSGRIVHGETRTTMGENGRPKYHVIVDAAEGRMSTIPHEVLGHIGWDGLTPSQRDVLMKHFGLDAQEQAAIVLGRAAVTGREFGTIGSKLRLAWDAFKDAVKHLLTNGLFGLGDRYRTLRDQINAEHILGRMQRGRLLPLAESAREAASVRPSSEGRFRGASTPIGNGRSYIGIYDFSNDVVEIKEVDAGKRVLHIPTFGRRASSTANFNVKPDGSVEWMYASWGSEADANQVLTAVDNKLSKLGIEPRHELVLRRFSDDEVDGRQSSSPVTPRERIDDAARTLPAGFGSFLGLYGPTSETRAEWNRAWAKAKAAGAMSAPVFYRTWRLENGGVYQDFGEQFIASARAANPVAYTESLPTTTAGKAVQRAKHYARNVLRPLMLNLPTEAHLISPEFGAFVEKLTKESSLTKDRDHARISRILERDSFVDRQNKWLSANKVITTDAGGFFNSPTKLTGGEYFALLRLGMNVDAGIAAQNGLTLDGNRRVTFSGAPSKARAVALKAWASGEIARDREVARMMTTMNEVTDLLYERIVEEFRKDGRTPPPKVDFYQALMREHDVNPTGKYGNQISKVLAEYHGWHERTKSKEPVHLMDAFSSFQRTAFTGLQATAWSRNLGILRAILGAKPDAGAATSQVALEFNRLLGQGTAERLVHHINAIEGTSDAFDQAGVSGFVMRWARRQDVARLAGPSTWVKQYGAMLMPIVDHPVGQVMRAISRARTISKTEEDGILNSDSGGTLWLRKNTGASVDDLAATSEAARSPMGKFDQWTRRAMYVTTKADWQSVRGYMSLAREVVNARDPGLKRRDIARWNNEVAEYTTDLVNRYQPVNRVDLRTRLHNMGTMGRLLERYRTPTNATFNSFYRSYLDAKRSGDPAKVRDTVRGMITAMAVQSLYFSIIGGTISVAGRSWKASMDEDEKERFLKDLSDGNVDLVAKDSASRMLLNSMNELADQVPLAQHTRPLRQFFASMIKYGSASPKTAYAEDHIAPSYSPFIDPAEGAAQVARSVARISELMKDPPADYEHQLRRNLRDAFRGSSKIADMTGLPASILERMTPVGIKVTDVISEMIQ